MQVLYALCTKSFYYSCFSKIKPGAPAVSKTPKCQEVLQIT